MCYATIITLETSFFSEGILKKSAKCAEPSFTIVVLWLRAFSHSFLKAADNTKIGRWRRACIRLYQSGKVRLRKRCYAADTQRAVRFSLWFADALGEDFHRFSGGCGKPLLPVSLSLRSVHLTLSPFAGSMNKKSRALEICSFKGMILWQSNVHEGGALSVSPLLCASTGAPSLCRSRAHASRDRYSAHLCAGERDKAPLEFKAGLNY